MSQVLLPLSPITALSLRTRLASLRRRLVCTSSCCQCGLAFGLLLANHELSRFAALLPNLEPKPFVKFDEMFVSVVFTRSIRTCLEQELQVVLICKRNDFPEQSRPMTLSSLSRVEVRDGCASLFVDRQIQRSIAVSELQYAGITHVTEYVNEIRASV